MKYILTALLCVCLATAPACASGAEQSLRSSLNLDGLERTAQGSDNGAGLALDDPWEDNLQRIVDGAKERIGGTVRESARTGVLLLATVMLCSLGEGLITEEGGGKLSAVTLAGVAVVTAVSVGDVNSMLGAGSAVIKSVTELSNVLLPTVAAVSAATGAITGAAARQAAAALFSSLLINAINGVFIPLLYGYIAACAAWAAVGNEGLKRVGSLFKWSAVTVLTIMMLCYVGYLTLSGVVTGSADAATVKAARFAISGAVPVVGGILADASESVLAAAGTLRGTVGVFGMLSVLAICLVPFLKLAVSYLLYKLCAALAATVYSGRVCGLIDSFAGAFGVILAMAAACALLLFISLVSSISVVTA